MNKFLLISISFLIFIIGIGCAAAADLDNGTNDSCGLGPNDHVFADDGQLSRINDDKRLYADDSCGLGPNDHVYASDDSLGKWFGPDKRIYASADGLGQMQPQPYDPLALGMLGPHDHVFASADSLGMLGPHDHVF